MEESGLEGFDPASRLCPYWVERRCTARGPRPLGCRAFFCDESKADAMADLHERTRPVASESLFFRRDV